jgi:hypothetical protein
MMKELKTYINPFLQTKSTEMNDAEIERLWVASSVTDNTNSITSNKKVFFIGSKGSGKTHLLRKHSYQVQKLRFNENSSKSLQNRIRDEGYIGVYYKCTSNMVTNFVGKGISDDIWVSLFKYSLEILLSIELINIISDLLNKDAEPEVCKDIHELFLNKDNIPEFKSLKDVEKYLGNLNKNIYLSVNDLGSDKKSLDKININIRSTSFILGLPSILKRHCNILQDINVIYIIDELEHLNKNQQKFVNTLIFDCHEVGIKIGVRKYGIKTLETLGLESLKNGSEKEEIILDDILREIYKNDAKSYKNFFTDLFKRRIQEYDAPFSEKESSKPIKLKDYFENFDYFWNSPDIHSIITASGVEERRHFKKFRRKLENLRISNIDTIINNLSLPDYPILEKSNILNFYKLTKNNSNFLEISSLLKEDALKFTKCKNLNEARKQKLHTFKLWEHYKLHLFFQLFIDYGKIPYYCGFDDLITVSEGAPRNFLNLLSYIDYRSYKMQQNPRLNGKKAYYSVDVQKDAFKHIANSFFDDINECNDKEKVCAAVDKLAQLFQINHYSDKPKECSLISFSCENISLLNDEAKNIIEQAVFHSLIIEEKSGRVSKNNINKRRQFRLNKILCPKWNLPLTTGGTTEISIQDINSIFDYTLNEEFKKLRDKWISDTTFSLESQNRFL